MKYILSIYSATSKLQWNYKLQKKKKIEFKLFGFVAKLCPIFSNCVSIVCSINRCTFPLKIDYSSRCKNSPESCSEKRSIGWQRTCVSNLWTLAHLTYNAMTINKHRNKFATLLSTLNTNVFMH